MQYGYLLKVEQCFFQILSLYLSHYHLSDFSSKIYKLDKTHFIGCKEGVSYSSLLNLNVCQSLFSLLNCSRDTQPPDKRPHGYWKKALGMSSRIEICRAFFSSILLLLRRTLQHPPPPLFYVYLIMAPSNGFAAFLNTRCGFHLWKLPHGGFPYLFAALPLQSWPVIFFHEKSSVLIREQKKLKTPPYFLKCRV